MASGRMIQRRISNNKDLPRLIVAVDAKLGAPHGAFAALVYTWCIAHLDVEGRMHGDPDIVKGTVVPRVSGITSDSIRVYLEAMAETGLVTYYDANGDMWLQFRGFKNAQPGLRKNREAPSTIPAPCGDVGSLPEQLRLGDGNTPAEVEEEVKEKRSTREDPPYPPSGEPASPDGMRGTAQPSQPLPLPGKPTATVKRIVDRWRTAAEAVLDALNAARSRVRASSRGITATYDSLAHIANRLEAGKSVEDCLHVVAVCEADCSSDDSAFKWFDAVTPFRAENFERKCAADPVLSRSNGRNGTPKPKHPPLVEHIGYHDEDEA